MSRFINDPEVIRGLDSFHLHDQMARRFPDQIFFNIYPVNHHVGVTLTYKPTGMTIKAVMKTAFEGKREAYALLLEALALDAEEGPDVPPCNVDELWLLAALVFGEHPNLITVGDLRTAASEQISALRKKVARSA